MDTATPPLAVDARHLVKRYRSKTAVDGTDLQLRAGETFGLLGTNGAGKTTTVEMLAGLRRPTQGSVRVLGLNPFSDLMRFLILGILLDGPLSLYDMRKQFAAGISLFYTASSGSIQRALGQLASHGWVTILDADDSRRRKKVYVVNDAGQQAWREWMHAPVTASDAGPTMPRRSSVSAIMRSWMAPEGTVGRVRSFMSRMGPSCPPALQASSPGPAQPPLN